VIKVYTLKVNIVLLLLIPSTKQKFVSYIHTETEYKTKVPDDEVSTSYKYPMN